MIALNPDVAHCGAATLVAARQQAGVALRRPLEISDAYERIANLRNSMYIWAWRLRMALDLFWHNDPYKEELEDFAFSGWSSRVRRNLWRVFDAFVDEYTSFEAALFHHPEDPIRKFWFRSLVPTDSKREKGGRLEAADGSWFTPFLCRGKFFTSAQLLNWGIAPEELDACFVGREADRICSIFEKRKISDAIFRAGFSLEVDVFEELFPAWHDRDDSNWIDDERPVTPLSRDDIAVATWLRLTSNGEQ